MNRPRALLAYVLAVETAAGAAVVVLPPYEFVAHATITGLLVLLAALIGTRPIRIPGRRTEVSATDPFVLAALVSCGGLPAVMTAAAGVLGAGSARGRRPRALRLVFNVAASALAAAAAYGALRLAGGGVGVATTRQLLPLAAASSAYFLVNTLLVAGAVSIERGVSFVSNWRSTALWTSLSVFSGLTIASLLLLLLDTTGPTGLVLGLPPCWLLLMFYQSHRERLERQQEQMEQMTVYSERLEAEVRDRTLALREAVTKLESANREMRGANVRLSEANRAKNAFLANMSHELRTPLNAIIGFSELMADGRAGPLTVEQRSHCHDIRDSGLHLLNLIDGILDLAKIEAGRLDVRREDVDPRQLLEESAAMLRPQAERAGLALRVDCADRLGPVRLDPGLFRQVLVNLLSNAVKFTPEGGCVELCACRDGDGLVVTVRDTGIGIPPEQQARIFEEFYQVDGSYARRYPGSGLGLALVRRMVRLHGGVVRLDSRPGRGSTFTVTVPGCFADYENAMPSARGVSSAS